MAPSRLLSVLNRRGLCLFGSIVPTSHDDDDGDGENRQKLSGERGEERVCVIQSYEKETCGYGIVLPI